MEVGGKDLGGKLPCRKHSPTLGQSVEERIKVGWLYDVKVLVGGSALGASHPDSRIVDGHTEGGQEGLQLGQAEGVPGLIDKVHLVAKEMETENAPHIVGVIGIIPIHTPTTGRRGECAKHQQACIDREERLKRMCLDIHNLLLLGEIHHNGQVV